MRFLANYVGITKCPHNPNQTTVHKVVKFLGLRGHLVLSSKIDESHYVCTLVVYEKRWKETKKRYHAKKLKKKEGYVGFYTVTKPVHSISLIRIIANNLWCFEIIFWLLISCKQTYLESCCGQSGIQSSRKKGGEKGKLIILVKPHHTISSS